MSGKNSFAVHCMNKNGGKGIDVGLVKIEK